MGGRVVVEAFESRLLEGNALGDPTVRQVPVYLPPSYGKDTGRRYPVIHVLAGYTGTGLSFLNFAAFSETLPQQIDRLIAAGEVGEVIFVMPDCYTRLGGSQYLDSPSSGPYMSMLVNELIPFIDGKYATVAERSHRGIVGKSSGGFGALVLAMRHPELFSAVGSHAGDMYFSYCYQPDFPKFLQALTPWGTIEAFLDDVPNIKDLSGSFFTLMSILAMATAYSPNPEGGRLKIDLPFDLVTGELRPDVWSRWLAWDPLNMLDIHHEALKQYSLVFLDAGKRDEYALQFGARIFSKKLDRHGIRHVHEEFSGGHRGTSYRYDRSFSLMSAALGAPGTKLPRGA